MNYSEAITWLRSLQLFGARPGLERIESLTEQLGHPERRLRFLHVAGTNGKGSTCALLEAAYRHSGRRVGLFTSPHLVCFRERIQIQRQMIPEAEVARLAQSLRPLVEAFPADQHPTFFEAVTALALQYFAEQSCDLVVWETGLGGRLDATNVVTPLASVITNVQFDHEKWLGATLPEIAREKAGIIKEGVPVITAAQGEAQAVIRTVAAERQAPLHEVTEPWRDGFALRGPHQQWNAAVAHRVLSVLHPTLPTTEDDWAYALTSVQWPARFQVWRRGAQTWVLDGAHNPDGALALAETLQREFPDQPFTLVLGILEDKSWTRVVHTLAANAARILLTRVASERTADPRLLEPECRRIHPAAEIQTFPRLPEALEAVGPAPLVVVAGSLYLMGEALELLGQAPAVQERSLNDWTCQPGAR